MRRMSAWFWAGVLFWILVTLIWTIIFGLSWGNIAEGGVASFYLVIGIGLVTRSFSHKPK